MNDKSQKDTDNKLTEAETAPWGGALATLLKQVTCALSEIESELASLPTNLSIREDQKTGLNSVLQTYQVALRVYQSSLRDLGALDGLTDEKLLPNEYPSRLKSAREEVEQAASDAEGAKNTIQEHLEWYVPGSDTDTPAKTRAENFKRWVSETFSKVHEGPDLVIGR